MPDDPIRDELADLKAQASRLELELSDLVRRINQVEASASDSPPERADSPPPIPVPVVVEEPAESAPPVDAPEPIQVPLTSRRDAFQRIRDRLTKNSDESSSASHWEQLIGQNLLNRVGALVLLLSGCLLREVRLRSGVAKSAGACWYRRTGGRRTDRGRRSVSEEINAYLCRRTAGLRCRRALCGGVRGVQFLRSHLILRRVRSLHCRHGHLDGGIGPRSDATGGDPGGHRRIRNADRLEYRCESAGSAPDIRAGAEHWPAYQCASEALGCRPGVVLDRYVGLVRGVGGFTL